jgi:nicotinamidase-related amidase
MTDAERFEAGDAVLVVDVFTDFSHEDGAALFESFSERASNMARVLAMARAAGVLIVYANDERDTWRSDAPGLVADALHGVGRGLITPLVPARDDPILLKHRYSAFDHTALDILLSSSGTERVILIGAATEGCVVQTAIDARERGLKASIVVNACATVDPKLEQTALRYARLVAGAHLEEVTRDGRRAVG